MRFNEVFEKVRTGHHLTFQESGDVVRSMMQDSWEALQTGSLLTAMHVKGETAEELAGFATAMRDAAVAVPLDDIDAMDNCGTGGDRKGSFNISTLAAFVLAGCGIPLAKHGNRAASSECGSADLLKALGIRYRLHPEEAASAVTEIGFAFLFAPDFHPATRSVAQIRKQLGTPTIFNLLGPLTNPAKPRAQVIGVYKKSALAIMTEAIQKSDPQRRAVLLHGDTGWDEATPCCDFLMHHTTGKIELRNAEHFGIKTCEEHELKGGSPAQNGKIAMSVLKGDAGPPRQAVLLNALLGYLVYFPKASIEEARDRVTASIDSGASMHIVERLREKFPGEDE